MLAVVPPCRSSSGLIVAVMAAAAPSAAAAELAELDGAALSGIRDDLAAIGPLGLAKGKGEREGGVERKAGETKRVREGWRHGGRAY